MNGERNIARAEGAMDGPREPEQISCRDTAKAIRKHLKGQGIKPKSVIMSRFSGGTSINIYVDRDTWNRVDISYWQQFCRTYSYGWFDGMNDSYNYYGKDHCIVYEGRMVRPGAKYVNVSPTQ